MILYLDCVGGAAGDMVLAALIDAGAPLDAINTELTKLGVPGLTVATERVLRHTIGCCHVTVTWDHQHDHDDGHDHDDDHDDDDDHNDGHDHDDGHGHPHRPYHEVRALISLAGLAPRVEERAQRVFAVLAAAEGHLHDVDPELVHFHEVGSEDSIADVVGVAIALELLGIDEIECSPLPIGRGFVRSAHGVMPLPAPATLELLRDVPTIGVEIEKELVTPTGAAIVKALATRFGTFPDLAISKVGYGAGGRDLPERPNVVRAVLGTRAGHAQTRSVVVIETNLDDLSPELVPDATAALFAAGALDVWTTPVLMKKGRPGFVLSAVARPTDRDTVAEVMLRETSALGVRMTAYERLEVERSFVTVNVAGETVAVKIGRRNGTVVNVAPEHDDCAVAAQRLGRPVKEVYARALAAALDLPTE